MSVSLQSNTNIRIVCLGNALHGNDSLGVHVFNSLQDVSLAGDCEIIFGGTGGLSLITIFRDCKRVLIVDVVACETAEDVGEVLFIRDLRSNLLHKENSSAEHGGDLSTLINLLPVFLSEIPEIDLLCVSAQKDRFFDTELDFTLHKVVSELCRKVQAYVRDNAVANCANEKEVSVEDTSDYDCASNH